MVLALDQDNAGKVAALAIAKQLQERGLLVCIPVDVDRIALVKAYVEQRPVADNAIDDERVRQLRGAQLQLADDIIAQGVAVQVHWGGCKDVNDLHIRRRFLAGRMQFMRMLSLACAERGCGFRDRGDCNHRQLPPAKARRLVVKP